MLDSRRDKELVLITALLLSIIALLSVGYIEQSILATLNIWMLMGALGTALLLIEGKLSTVPQAWVYKFWVTYSLRIFVMTLLHSVLKSTPQWPWWDFGSGGGDELGFWLESDNLVEAWHTGAVWVQEAGRFGNYYAWLEIVGFVRFVSSLFDGETVFNVRIFLCMAGALIVPYVYAMAQRVFGEQTARVAALLAFLLPDYWFYSSTMMRDILVSCVMIMIYYHAVEMLHRRAAWWHLLLAMGLNLGVLRYLRTETAYVNLIIIGLCAIYYYHEERTNPTFRIVSAFFIIIVVFGMFTDIFVLLTDIDLRGYPLEMVEKAARYYVLSQEEASSSSLGAVLWDLPFVLRIPLGTIFIFFEPIPPWAALQGGEGFFFLRSLILTAAGFVWFGLVSFFPVGLLGCLSANQRRSMWIWATTLILASSLAFSTATHPRLRLMLMPFLLMIIARGMIDWRRHSKLYGSTAISMALGLIIYSALKYL